MMHDGLHSDTHRPEAVNSPGPSTTQINRVVPTAWAHLCTYIHAVRYKTVKARRTSHPGIQEKEGGGIGQGSRAEDQDGEVGVCRSQPRRWTWKERRQRCFREQRDAEDTVMTYSIRIDLDKRTTGTVRRVDQDH